MNSVDLISHIDNIKDDKNSPSLDLIIGHFSSYIYSLLKRFAVDENEKCVFYNDAVIGLYSAVRSFDVTRGVPFEPYAKICIKRAVFNSLKHYTRSNKTCFSDCLYIEDLSDGYSKRALELYCEYADPQSAFIRKEELSAFLRNAKSLLTSFEWEVFGYYVDDFSYAQIAERLGRNVKSISNAVYRIRNKLSVIN